MVKFKTCVSQKFFTRTPIEGVLIANIVGTTYLRFQMTKYRETKLTWIKTKTYGHWKCAYCLRDSVTKYIATGHDHTDYYYNTCDCVGARMAGGKPYDELN